jgi:hypothetical protein
LDITAVQGEQEDADSIQISELGLIEEAIQQSPLVTISDVIDRHPDNSPNIKSTRITYAANTDATAVVTLDALSAGNDLDFSDRDFFQFYLKISDINLLDTNAGNIKLGNNKDTFYRWNIADIPNLQTGSNKIKLQFSEAFDKSEIPFQSGPNFDSRFGESQVDFVTEDVEVTTSIDGSLSARTIQSPGIRFFEIEFRGTKAVVDTELELRLDDFRFVRNRFDDVCKFRPSLYLNNSETMLINMEGIDISTGTVEFWFQPDWGVAARLAAPRTTIIPAIFRILRPDGKFLSLFYRPNTGFVSMIFDGEQLLQFESNVSLYNFDSRETFHFALVWDANREASVEKASLVMYFNGEPVYGSDKTWRALREGRTTLMFGGEMGQRFASSPHNSTALAFTPVPTLPAKNTASVWALMENLKIYNYAKTDFSDINSPDLERTQLITPSQLLEISTDGINFEGIGSSNLPLVVGGVPSGESTTIFLRSNLPRNLTGDENRDASLLVRWKTPLQQCD